MDYIFNESKGNDEITTILTFLDTIQTPVFLRNVDFANSPNVVHTLKLSRIDLVFMTKICNLQLLYIKG